MLLTGELQLLTASPRPGVQLWTVAACREGYTRRAGEPCGMWCGLPDCSAHARLNNQNANRLGFKGHSRDLDVHTYHQGLVSLLLEGLHILDRHGVAWGLVLLHCTARLCSRANSPLLPPAHDTTDVRGPRFEVLFLTIAHARVRSPPPFLTTRVQLE